jgi:hypothetical protein
MLLSPAIVSSVPTSRRRLLRGTAAHAAVGLLPNRDVTGQQSEQVPGFSRGLIIPPAVLVQATQVIE